jgi:hypothetical protein
VCVFSLSALTEEFEAGRVTVSEALEDVRDGEVLLGGGDEDVLGFCAVGPGDEFLGGVFVFFALVLMEFPVPHISNWKSKVGVWGWGGGGLRGDFLALLEFYGGEF